jgi:hypothetical protein
MARPLHDRALGGVYHFHAGCHRLPLVLLYPGGKRGCGSPLHNPIRSTNRWSSLAGVPRRAGVSGRCVGGLGGLRLRGRFE